MKLRHRVVLITAIMCGCWLPALLGQTGGPVIPPNIKTSNAALPEELIRNFISGEVAKLSNPATQPQARANLVAGVTVPTKQQATPAYLDFYATVLNDQLKPLATSPDPRVRLNAAIVTSKVAERCDNTRLGELAQTFMNDENEGIVLWGVKAAKSIVPAILRNPGADKQIVDSMVAAVKKHPSGPLVEDAYKAADLLNLDRINPAPPPAPRILATAANIMLDLLEQRVRLYIVAIPSDPSADEVAATYLSSGRVWATLTSDQRKRVLQLLSDLVGLVGKRAAAAAGRADIDRAMPLLRNLGANLQVIGSNVNSPGLQSAAVALTKVSVSLSPPEIGQRCAAVCLEIQSVPQFKDIKPPPDIQAAAATAPSAPITDSPAAAK